MKHHPRYSKPRDLYPELVQRILADEQKLAASRAKLEAERAAESTARVAQDAANSTAALQAALPAAEPPTHNQPAAPITDSQISKETQEMSSTPVAHAKAALRAKASNGRSESISLPARSASKASSDASDLDPHSRKCQVCRHPHRETIEELFVNWHSPRDIAEEFDGSPRLDWPSIYRHARAMGLYVKRSRNLRAVFDLVLENASSVTPTAHGIVAVARAYTALTENNTWDEPEKRVHIINHIFRHDVPPPSDLPGSPGRRVANFLRAGPAHPAQLHNCAEHQRSLAQFSRLQLRASCLPAWAGPSAATGLPAAAGHLARRNSQT